jgi:predicted nucleic acid-binding protein
VETAVRKQILRQTPWLKTVALNNPQHALTYTGLDQGEAEVLALAIEHKARLVVIDELKGRRYAHRLGLSLTGTLGVLLLAKERGLITAIAPVIEQLNDNGLYFSSELVEQTLALAGEMG